MKKVTEPSKYSGGELSPFSDLNKTHERKRLIRLGYSKFVLDQVEALVVGVATVPDLGGKDILTFRVNFQKAKNTLGFRCRTKVDVNGVFWIIKDGYETK